MTVIPARPRRRPFALRAFVAFAEWLGAGSTFAVLTKIWLTMIVLPYSTYLALNANGIIS